MKKWIPMEKRSKKEQKAYYSAQRGSWNGVIPVTKLIPNKKHTIAKRSCVGRISPTQFFRLYPLLFFVKMVAFFVKQSKIKTIKTTIGR